jgi:hypothetical protein
MRESGDAARFRLAHLLTLLIIPLAALASAGGLFIPDLYRDAPGVLPAIKGQDLITLVSTPVLALVLRGVMRGSARATMAWMGLLGYLAYAYTGAAFAYRFNRFFLAYLILFSLSVTALAAAIAGVDATAIRSRFDRANSCRPIVVFLILVAFMLAASELGQVIPAMLSNEPPDLIVRSEWMGNFVYVLDLGVVVPLTILSAVGIRRTRPWAFVLGGGLMIKAVTMGLALLAATWFSVRAGQSLERGLTIAYAAMAVAAIGLSAWFFRHCRD